MAGQLKKYLAVAAGSLLLSCVLICVGCGKQPQADMEAGSGISGEETADIGEFLGKQISSAVAAQKGGAPADEPPLSEGDVLAKGPTIGEGDVLVKEPTIGEGDVLVKEPTLSEGDVPTKEPSLSEEERFRRQQITGILYEFDRNERENLAEYIALDEIGEDGAWELDSLRRWKESGMEGSFIADGYNEAERELEQRLEKETGKIACWMSAGDFDGNGTEEVFAFLFDLKNNNMEEQENDEIWFAAADGSLQCIEEAVHFADFACLEISGKTFLRYDIYGKDQGDDTHLYEVNGNTAKRTELDCGYGVDVMEDGRVWVLCREKDSWSYLGHYGEILEQSETMLDTNKYYYYRYEGDGFYEYSGVPITEEEFCQYENGEKIIHLIKAQHYIVKDIYYYGDGRMVVNFMEGNLGYEGRPRNNYYMQIPILAQGEEGFVLEWDDSYDFWGLYALDHWPEWDIFIANGIYRAAYMPELARYPEFTSPLNYYKEKFAALEKSALKICAVQEQDGEKGEPAVLKPGRILADGTDLLGMDGLVFRFVPEYDMSALLAQVPGEVGIWIDGEYICSGSLQTTLDGEGAGFLVVDQKGEPPIYRNCLVYQNNAAARQEGSYHEGAQVKLCAFAGEVGLYMEEDITKLRAGGVYDGGRDYLLDLNGDGVEDVFRFGEGELWINGINYWKSVQNREMVDTDAFMLGDIDTEDEIWEIALWEPESGEKGSTDIYWYDGEMLRFSGSLEGLWSEDGPEVKYCNDGTINVKCRLHILQVWWTDKSFYLDEGHNLVEDKGDGWYWAREKEESDEVLRYEVLQPVYLYTHGDKDGDFVILPPGERFFVMMTDGENYITIESESAFGKLYLEDGMRFENPEGGFYGNPEEVIGGLYLGE